MGKPAAAADAPVVIGLLDGTRIPLHLPLEHTTLAQLREAIAQSTQVPAEQQRLLFSGRELHGDASSGRKTLQKAGIGANGIRFIHMVRRPTRPGQGASAAATKGKGKTKAVIDLRETESPRAQRGARRQRASAQAQAAELIDLGADSDGAAENGAPGAAAAAAGAAAAQTQDGGAAAARRRKRGAAEAAAPGGGDGSGDGGGGAPERAKRPRGGAAARPASGSSAQAVALDEPAL